MLVFVLAVAFSASSSLAFIILASSFGLDAAQAFSHTGYFVWIERGITLAFFLAFYRIGKKVDFRNRYGQLSILVFVGVLAGQLPTLVAISSGLSGSITGFSFYADPNAFISFLVTTFESFAIPVAGLSLAYFLRASLHETQRSLVVEAKDGEKRVPLKMFLILAFVIVVLSYLAEGLVDVIGSRFPGSDNFAFLKYIFAPYSPYGSYAFDFFYPLLFFIIFYFLGRRIDTGRNGLKAFAASVFVGGVLGSLVGLPLDYYVRTLAVPSSQTFPPFTLGYTFFVGLIVVGLDVLAFAFAAASLGFLRSLDHPQNSDRWVAISLVVTILLITAISAYFAASSTAFSGTTTVTITSVSSTTTAAISPSLGP